MRARGGGGGQRNAAWSPQEVCTAAACQAGSCRKPRGESGWRVHERGQKRHKPSHKVLQHAWDAAGRAVARQLKHSAPPPLPHARSTPHSFPPQKAPQHPSTHRAPGDLGPGGQPGAKQVAQSGQEGGSADNGAHHHGALVGHFPARRRGERKERQVAQQRTRVQRRQRPPPQCTCGESSCRRKRGRGGPGQVAQPGTRVQRRQRPPPQRAYRACSCPAWGGGGGAGSRGQVARWQGSPTLPLPNMQLSPPPNR